MQSLQECRSSTSIWQNISVAVSIGAVFGIVWGDTLCIGLPAPGEKCQQTSPAENNLCKYSDWILAAETSAITIQLVETKGQKGQEVLDWIASSSLHLPGSCHAMWETQWYRWYRYPQHDHEWV